MKVFRSLGKNGEKSSHFPPFLPSQRRGSKSMHFLDTGERCRATGGRERGAPFSCVKKPFVCESYGPSLQSSAHPRPMAAIGKRQRKETVSVYTVDSPTKKEFVIEEGKGTKLGDIPNGALPDVSRLPRHARSIRHFLKNEPRGSPSHAPRLTRTSRAPQSSSLCPRSRAMMSC